MNPEGKEYVICKCTANGLEGVVKVGSRYTVNQRPPIGLYPRFLHDEKRLDDVTQAILRYIDAHKVVPTEWWEEYNELAEREQKRKERK